MATPSKGARVRIRSNGIAGRHGDTVVEVVPVDGPPLDISDLVGVVRWELDAGLSRVAAVSIDLRPGVVDLDAMGQLAHLISPSVEDDEPVTTSPFPTPLYPDPPPGWPGNVPRPADVNPPPPTEGTP